VSNYAIIGAGNFGFTLAKTLFKGGENVIAIDTDEEVIHRIRDHVTKAVKADATHKENLIDLGINGVDAAVISLGQDMASSILVTLYVKEIGVPRIYVKAITDEHAKILEMMHVTEVVNPERDMAVRVAHKLMNPNMLDYLPFGPELSIIEMAPPDSFIGKSLKDLRIRNRYRVQVLAVKKLVPEGVEFLPDPNFILKDSDVMIIMGMNEDLDKLEKIK